LINHCGYGMHILTCYVPTMTWMSLISHHSFAICNMLLQTTFILFWMAPFTLDYLLANNIYPKWVCFIQTTHDPQDESANILPWCKRLFARMSKMFLVFCSCNGPLLPTITCNGIWIPWQTLCTFVSSCIIC
jgi:hypothetical protein